MSVEQKEEYAAQSTALRLTHDAAMTQYRIDYPHTTAAYKKKLKSAQRKRQARVTTDDVMLALAAHLVWCLVLNNNLYSRMVLDPTHATGLMPACSVIQQHASRASTLTC
jgi:hypothetical protein